MNDGRIEFRQSAKGEWTVYKKQYANENDGKVKPASIITEHGQTAMGKRDLKELFNSDIMSFPKPVALIKYLISSVENKDPLVLDFFSGSATTAHAVMQLNAEDGGNRKYIMVQLDEPVKKGSEADKEGFKTIDQIGRERIRRAAKKLAADYPDKAKNCDLGFKTYYLKQTDKQTLDKIKDFDPAVSPDSGDIIKVFGKDTILETWKIKDGYGFNTPAREIRLKEYKAYLIDDGIHGANLYILDEISDSQIMELVRKLEKGELVIDKIIEYG